ncbi:MAG: CDP-glycerol glycerophosphotransferase family protein [Clostridiales bacterium]|nr:CDP-glycerol glycerophosphotransferase family protein [Clostridiales bacterium]
MQQCSVVIDKIEFKRIILHLEGRLVNFKGKKTKLYFRCEESQTSIVPQHYDVEGDHFRVTMNVLSVNNESPMVSGNYYLTVEDDKQQKYHATLSERFEGELNMEPDNPANVRIHRNQGHYFHGFSILDLDTEEYILRIRAAIPPKQDFYMKRNFRAWKAKRKKHLHEIKGFVFVSLFNFFNKVVKKKGNKILFASGSRAEIGGNEEFIYKRMIERGLDKQFKFRFDFKANITEKRGIFKKIRFAYLLATSDIILIDDYYPDIYQVNFAKGVKIIQVWHACGAFKALGLERMDKPGAPPLNTRVHKCYTAVPVSSEHSLRHHAEAFGIDESKFYPVGIPRTDIFFDEEYKKNMVEQLHETFPQTKTAKKVYMYAPTFRGDNAVNAYFPFDRIDLKKWGKKLKEEGSLLLIKMHPFVREKVQIPEEYKDYIIDAASYREVNDLLFIVDVLITDYSSIIYEFSLLRRPMYFYAFDRNMYVSTRDFYETYEDIVPGKIIKNFDELLDTIGKDDYSKEALDAFIRKNFTYTDGKATDRVIDQIILGKDPE